MAVEKLTQIAARVFRANPNANKLTKMVNSAKVEVFREGTNGLRKIVTQPGKMTTISHIAENGKVTGIRQVTPRGDFIF